MSDAKIRDQVKPLPEAQPLPKSWLLQIELVAQSLPRQLVQRLAACLRVLGSRQTPAAGQPQLHWDEGSTGQRAAVVAAGRQEMLDVLEGRTPALAVAPARGACIVLYCAFNPANACNI